MKLTDSPEVEARLLASGFTAYEHSDKQFYKDVGDYRITINLNPEAIDTVVLCIQKNRNQVLPRRDVIAVPSKTIDSIYLLAAYLAAAQSEA